MMQCIKVLYDAVFCWYFFFYKFAVNFKYDAVIYILFTQFILFSLRNLTFSTFK